MTTSAPLPWPTVQLIHELPDGTQHVDWMIAQDPRGEGPLVAFHVERRVDGLEVGGRIDARRIPDHRPEYLTYEGPVSDGRGTVRRLAEGAVRAVDERPEALWLEVEWTDADRSQVLRLRRIGQTDKWAVEAREAFESAPDAGLAPGGPSWGEHHQKGRTMAEDVNRPGGTASGRIRPAQPGVARTGADEPLPVAEGVGQVGVGRRITAIEKAKRHEETWNRTPNTTGQGAIHVKTFHSKLTDDALAYMDQCVNEWLDAHPEYEVKFVNSTVGTLTAKLKEPHLICQVWV